MQSGVKSGSELLLPYAALLSSPVSVMDYGFADERLGKQDHIVLPVTANALLSHWAESHWMPTGECL